MVFALSCGGDDGGSPNLDYPDLPAALRDALCVRGNVTVGNSPSGTLADTDCDLGDSYFETYVLKVATDRSVDISMESSQFDTYLFLLRLNSFTADSADLDVITSDDDSGTGTNALISDVALDASSDYIIVANGFDYSDVGSYTLRVR
jgi:hypothetical protein